MNGRSFLEDVTMCDASLMASPLCQYDNELNEWILREAGGFVRGGSAFVPVTKRERQRSQKMSQVVVVAQRGRTRRDTKTWTPFNSTDQCGIIHVWRKECYGRLFT